MVAPLTVFTGRSFSSLMVSVLPFISTWYSSGPSLAVPEGRIRFSALTAFTTSVGDRPLACMAAESISIETSRCFPPYGQGTAAPCTVANWVRIVLAPRSNNCCSLSRVLLRPTCSTGTVDAL
jgi:hypothetical protein